ncbi:MAG: hypothetical protein NHG36_00295, partial [Chromatiaceae bacterium]|nr:hypothetical protein [Candidatus Thioaporhodococcus sediminis]
ADASLIAPAANTARIQEAHLLAGHILCDLVEAHFSVAATAPGPVTAAPVSPVPFAADPAPPLPDAAGAPSPDGLESGSTPRRDCAPMTPAMA